MIQEFQCYAQHYDVFMLNQDRYVAMLDFHRQAMLGRDRVIDAGCGTGNLTRALLEDGHAVLAVDPDQESLEVLEEKCADFDRLTVEQADNLDFVPENSYDGTCSSIVIGFQTIEIEDYLAAIARALRPGALFSISAWAPVNNLFYGAGLLALREFEQKGITESIQDTIDAVLEKGGSNMDLIYDRKITLPKLKTHLKAAGFEGIEVVDENPYGPYQHWLTCRRQNPQ